MDHVVRRLSRGSFYMIPILMLHMIKVDHHNQILNVSCIHLPINYEIQRFFGISQFIITINYFYLFHFHNVY